MTSVSTADSYVTARNPGKYGGMQEDYVVRSQCAIDGAIGKITTGVAEGKDLTELFFEVLEELGAARQAIAVAHGTKDSQYFGRRRDVTVPREESEVSRSMGLIAPQTWLDCEYRDYNKIFMERLRRVISSMRHDKKEFTDTLRVEKEVVLGRASQCTVEILTPDRVNALGEYVTIEEVKKASGVDSFETLLAFGNNKEAMLALKRSDPALYTRLKMSHYLQELIKRYPSPKKIEGPFGSYEFVGDTSSLKSLYVLATNRLEIDGKLYTLSQYLTWMYCDWVNDPVDRMKERSTVAVLHQDSFLIEETLKDISRLFREAVLWDRGERRDLLNKVALLRYELAHCMPFGRGSAAIAEWIEAAIYRYHGFHEFRHVKSALADLEALSSLTLDDFMKCYGITITGVL